MERKKLDALVAELSSKDSNARRHARTELVKAGADAVIPLAELIHEKDHKLRWEVVKTLSEINSFAAAGPLIEALKDEKSDVRWIAAEGLVHLGKEILPTLMHGIIEHYKSNDFRSGVHHVLKSLKHKGLFEDTDDLIHQLEKHIYIGKIPVYAEKVLEKITLKKEK